MQLPHLNLATALLSISKPSRSSTVQALKIALVWTVYLPALPHSAQTTILVTHVGQSSRFPDPCNSRRATLSGW
jgi:hypothetical protein